MMKVCLLFSVVLYLCHLTHAVQDNSLSFDSCVDANGNELVCMDDFICKKDDRGVAECMPLDAQQFPQTMCPNQAEIEAQEVAAGGGGDVYGYHYQCTTDLDCPEDKVCCSTNYGMRCADMLVPKMVVDDFFDGKK